MSVKNKKQSAISPLHQKCIDKFLYHFPGGFSDPKYLDCDRRINWKAHLLWQKNLGKKSFCDRLNKGDYARISSDAVRIACKTELLNDSEKKGIRYAVKSEGGARIFAIGLYNYLYGQGSRPDHFHTFTRVLETLPGKFGSLVTWPIQTVFGFIARPLRYIAVTPDVIIRASAELGSEITCSTNPDWVTYQSILDLTSQVAKDIKQLKPRDMMDLHFFLTVVAEKGAPDEKVGE